jgi:hypothetical protein
VNDVVTTIVGNIEAGALIVDAEGGHWRVIERRIRLPKIALLITSGQRTFWATKEYGDDVTLVDESHGRAVANVLSALGGTMLIDELPKGPDRPGVRSLYAAHLFHHHKVWVGSGSSVNEENTLQGLIELHALEHASPRPDWLPHEHGKVV